MKIHTPADRDPELRAQVVVEFDTWPFATPTFTLNRSVLYWDGGELVTRPDEMSRGYWIGQDSLLAFMSDGSHVVIDEDDADSFMEKYL